MIPVIEIEGLKKYYPLPRKVRHNSRKYLEALKGVNLTVNRGEIFGILGPNGAGKTTILSILEGLRSASEGRVFILGKDIKKETATIKQRIGVQLQHNEYPPLLTLAELLELFASLYAQKADVKKLLGFVGLEDKIHNQVKELSGGQKQRFTIATSLVNEPEILFLDEPTTGLDPRARRDIWRLIKEINARGITIVITTHYMEEAEYLCDRVAIIDRGRILTIDNPKTLINNLSHTTQVSFFTDQTIEADWWKNAESVEKVYSYHPKVILEIKSLDHISDILKILQEHTIKFTGFTVKTATLEDVYLDLTGHEFEVETENGQK